MISFMRSAAASVSVIAFGMGLAMVVTFNTC